MNKFLISSPDEVILKVIKDEKDIIYGARSIKKQIGIAGRQTFDYDAFALHPRKDAEIIEHRLDKKFKPVYYVKMAKHKGTWKVMNMGLDKKQGTKDDFSVADFSSMPHPTPKYVVIGGIRYRILSEEKKAKLNVLKDKEFKFRWKKDSEDLRRIKQLKEMKKWRLI